MRAFRLPSLLTYALGALLAFGTACDKNGNVNLLSIDQDKQLGAQTAAQIAADPTTYPILDSATHASAYAYIYGIRNNILNSGKLTYKDDFVWRVQIINDPNTLNAFCTPGGYIYVYTGLIKYLDKVDQLAGVMGHEMGHADLRHTSRQITQQQGYDVVVQALLGNNPGTLAQLALQLKDLKYSRGYETEADEASVKYLGGTSYACNGAAGFFEKLINAGQSQSQPVFLSTHPADKARVDDINSKAQKAGCNETPLANGGYDAFKALLP